MSSNNAYILKVGDNILDFSELKTQNFVIETEVNSKYALLVKNMGDLEHLKIDIKDGSKLTLSLLFDEANKNLEFEINVYENASLEAYIAEFSRTNLQINGKINLSLNPFTLSLYCFEVEYPKVYPLNEISLSTIYFNI